MGIGFGQALHTSRQGTSPPAFNATPPSFFRSLRRAPCQLMGEMLSIGCENLKICWRIVLSIAVFVMHYLSRQKKSAENIFHYKSMLGEIAVLMGVRVRRLIYMPVATDQPSAASPKRISLARLCLTLREFRNVERSKSKENDTLRALHLAGRSINTLLDKIGVGNRAETFGSCSLAKTF